MPGRRVELVAIDLDAEDGVVERREAMTRAEVGDAAIDGVRMIETEKFGICQTRAQLLDFISVLQTLEKAVTDGALVDDMKEMGNQPFSHRVFIEFSRQLLGVNLLHDIGATDLQCPSNCNTVFPGSALPCHVLLTAADNLGSWGWIVLGQPIIGLTILGKLTI